MKTTIKIALLSLLSAVSCSAATSYFGFNVGYLTNTHAALYSARVGYNVAQDDLVTQSVEAEVMYSHYTDLGVNFDLNPFMVNYRVNFATNSPWVFSSGAGVGISRLWVGYHWINDHDTAFTYQLFGSAGYKIDPHVALVAAIRYLNIGKAKIENVRARVGNDTSLELGVRYGF